MCMHPWVGVYTDVCADTHRVSLTPLKVIVPALQDQLTLVTYPIKIINIFYIINIQAQKKVSMKKIMQLILIFMHDC